MSEAKRKRGRPPGGPRIRTIKPEAWEDERLGMLSRDARLCFWVLVSMADDEGRVRMLPWRVIGHGYPYDEDVRPPKLKKWVREIVESDMLLSYAHNEVEYLAFRNWRKHQKINRGAPSILPPPPDPEVVAANAVPESDDDDAPGYRKARVPDRVRREVARRSGAVPGETTSAECEDCGAEGSIWWPRLQSTGKPGSWVHFNGLELDHHIPEVLGGRSEAGNIRLLCQECNRRKGHRLPDEDTVGVTDRSRDSVTEVTESPAQAGGDPGPVPDPLPGPASATTTEDSKGRREREIAEVWEHYLDEFYPDRRGKLPDLRAHRQHIVAALRVRPVEECKLAVTGLARSEFHRGQNGDGKRWTEIRYALHGNSKERESDAERIDRMAARAADPVAGFAAGLRAVDPVEAKLAQLRRDSAPSDVIEGTEAA